jgi:transglutaminase-like putative cysteine protease
MRYQITHKTTYDYAEPAATSHNQVHLKPREVARQECQRRDLSVQPPPETLTDHVDFFGNPVTSFAIFEPHSRLTITAVSRVNILDPGPTSPPASPAWEELPARLRTELDGSTLDASQYLFDSPYIAASPTLAEYARASFPKERLLFEAVLDLTQRIKAEFKYLPKATTLATSIEEVLEARHGVCQDFAHLQIGCLRSLGLAARYVSGYLRTDPPPGKPRLIGVDASHAWVSVYCPPVGWVDFDPTNGCITGDRHITLAWGRCYSDVSPIKGVVLGGGAHKLSVSVDVAPI